MCAFIDFLASMDFLFLDLRNKLRVTLVNAQGLDEPGIDGGGVFREFLNELLKTGFDPNRGYFTTTQDGQLYPNPQVQIKKVPFKKLCRENSKFWYAHFSVQTKILRTSVAKICIKCCFLSLPGSSV